MKECVICGMSGEQHHKKKLFELFERESYTEKDIQQLLGISNKDVRMLVKLISCKDGRYDRVDIVRACMGGILYAD